MRTLRIIIPFLLAGSALAANSVDSLICRDVQRREAELLKIVRSWHLDFVTTLTGESVPVFVPPANHVDDKVIFPNEHLISVGSMLVLDQIQAEITAVLDRHLEGTDAAYREVQARLLGARTDEEVEALRQVRDTRILKARAACRTGSAPSAR